MQVGHVQLYVFTAVHPPYLTRYIFQQLSASSTISGAVRRVDGKGILDDIKGEVKQGRQFAIRRDVFDYARCMIAGGSTSSSFTQPHIQ